MPEGPDTLPVMRGRLPRGLRRRITASGEVQYGLRIKSKWLPTGGDYRWFKVGTSRDEAEKRLGEVYDLLDRAKFGLTISPDRPQLHAVKSIAERYYAHLEKQGSSAGHVTNVRQRLGEFVSLHGPLPMLAVTRELVETYLDGMLRSDVHPKGRAPETVAGFRRILSGFFAFALTRERIIAVNPVVGTIPPRDNRPEDERRAALFCQELTPGRDRKLLDALPCAEACATALSLYHGQRLNAVISLRISGNDPDVDLVEGTIRFRGATLKRRKLGLRPRSDVLVRISKHALHYVTVQARAAVAAGSEWLHPMPSDPARRVNGDALSGNFHRAAVIAGFPNAYFHALLHVHSTRMKSSGLADVEEKALEGARLSRGHDGSEITKRYIHTPDSDLWALHDRLDSWIEERAESEKSDQGATKN